LKNTTRFLIVILLFPCIIFAGDLNRVESASNEQISAVKMLLNTDVVIKKSAVVKSSLHKRAYYVGLNFKVSGIEEMLMGIWIVSGDKYKPMLVLAVDGFAKNFSHATAADKTNPPTAYVFDNECRLLEKYLRPYQ